MALPRAAGRAARTGPVGPHVAVGRVGMELADVQWLRVHGGTRTVEPSGRLAYTYNSRRLRIHSCLFA
jgi:hypothetical protein